MKSVLTISLIIGFVSVAVFGFIGIGHIDEMAHHGCLAALSQNGVCPSATGLPAASAFYHLDILRSFSTALLTNALLLLALAGAAFFGLKNRIFEGDISPQSTALYGKLSEIAGSNFPSRNLSWLNLHLNSPASAFGA